MGVVEVRHGTGDGAVAPLASGPPGGDGGGVVPVAGARRGELRQFFPLAARLGRLPAVTIAHAADPAMRSARAAVLLDEAWRSLGADQ